MTSPVVKGNWYVLPSGKTAEVCRLKVVRLPRQDGDKGPRLATEVTLRFLNDDSEMAPGEFTLSLTFITTYCRRVEVAPAAAA